MKIHGLEGLDGSSLEFELQRGGRFVIYEYCISMLVLTLKRPSDIYFIRAGQGRVSKGLGLSLVTFLGGWWGFPWGPIYTVGALITNFRGGKDVTGHVVAMLQQHANGA